MKGSPAVRSCVPKLRLPIDLVRQALGIRGALIWCALDPDTSRSPTELAAELGCSRSTVTRKLARLVSSGWAEALDRGRYVQILPDEQTIENAVRPTREREDLHRVRYELEQRGYGGWREEAERRARLRTTDTGFVIDPETGEIDHRLKPEPTPETETGVDLDPETGELRDTDLDVVI